MMGSSAIRQNKYDNLLKGSVNLAQWCELTSLQIIHENFHLDILSWSCHVQFAIKLYSLVTMGVNEIVSTIFNLFCVYLFIQGLRILLLIKFSFIIFCT